MLTGESLEQLHADLTALAGSIRTTIVNSQAIAQKATAAVDYSFERGRQTGLLYALAKIERALEEAGASCP